VFQEAERRLELPKKTDTGLLTAGLQISQETQPWSFPDRRMIFLGAIARESQL
jgi:hypothetical protein